MTELATEGKPVPLAGCTRCKSPLISTFAWSKFEFYCVNCGALFDWLSPMKLEPTAKNEQRYQELLAEWEKLGGPNLLGGGVMLRDCHMCVKRDESHLKHASPEEIEAHEQALVALADRAGTILRQ